MRVQWKKPLQVALQRLFRVLAEWTGLEPATPGVTGRYSNQLNYHSSGQLTSPRLQALPDLANESWRPLGDSNPCNHRERVVSWASRRRGLKDFILS